MIECGPTGRPPTIDSMPGFIVAIYLIVIGLLGLVGAGGASVF
ncbi:MAG TPA: DUF3096 domain-containing protein [Xanthomonadaceae bacterium]|nr:DUF3096 domain-containing protein [Xanthomonadaceae bacterium]